MSANYSSGLSEYEHKGTFGQPEIVDANEEVKQKIDQLVQAFIDASYVVVLVGAGISTSAGIPDFRGPTGVWTLEKKGIKSESSISFDDAKPTFTHRALKALIDAGKLDFIISQNIDGLFLKTGIKRRHLAELHGNFYLDECNVCAARFLRTTPSPTMALKVRDEKCPRPGRPCRGQLRDTILDWEDALPETELEQAELHCFRADLIITLGTSLQIHPAGKMPFMKRKGRPDNRKTCIVNLQKTIYDKKADIVIHDYVDKVMEAVCERLQVKVEPYDPEQDQTKYGGKLKQWK